jgi:hypothetical protein
LPRAKFDAATPFALRRRPARRQLADSGEFQISCFSRGNPQFP